MAKKLIKYLLEGNGTIPAFVENGGYYPVGEELIGLSVDEDRRHVPATVGRMTKADLLARMQSLKIKDQDGNLLNNDQIAASADAFLEMLGIPDLA